MLRHSTAVGLAALMAVGLLIAPDPPVARAGYLPAPPRISIEPGCAPQIIEGTVAFMGTYHLRNFTPGAPVTIVYGFSEPPQQETVFVGPSGAVDATLTFNHEAFSNVTVTAFETANPQIAAETVLAVPCTPTLRLSPNCDAAADPAAPRNIKIEVAGHNWDPFGGPVTVALAQAIGEFEQLVSAPEAATPDTRGNFSVSLARAPDFEAPLMALPAGDYYVRASQRSGGFVAVDFVVPCAQVVLTPSCGEPGAAPDVYDLAVSGSGFRPFQQAQIIFDAFGQPQVFLLDVGETGLLTLAEGEEARITPFRRPELLGGAYAVVVRQETTDKIVREAATTFAVPCPPEPDVFIDPPCGPPQLVGDDPRTLDLRVTGVNLAPGLLTVTVDPDGRGGAPQTFEFRVSGSLDVEIAIARRPVGSYQIVATEDIEQPFVKTFTFDVPCAPKKPKLRLRCDPEETTQPELAEVVLVAQGFFDDGPLELTVGGVQTLVRTDAEGIYRQRMPAVDLPAGPLEAAAVQRDANAIVAEASAALVLPCGTREPTLLISPPAASAGLVVTVRGFNFRPNATIGLRWSRGIGSSRTIDVTADADGAFSRQVLIFHHDFAGVRELNVEASDDPFAADVSVSFVVVPGSGSPPVFADPSLAGFDVLILRR